ncbi:UbiD family decarboxylase [Candidatus Bathyarchaeota archaeon]|nr:UbiD family decarboxylase [Candidatus Bathyarchaeota archaeon]
MADLRAFIEEAEESKDIIHVEEVSPRFEASGILKSFDRGKIIIFDKVKGSSTSVVGGVCGTRTRLDHALGLKPGEFYDRLTRALAEPKTPMIADDGPVLASVEKPNLSKIPILTHYEKDAGPYITAGAIYAKVDGSENLSIHRLQVLDDTHLAIRIVPRHLYRLCQMARDKGWKTLDISISVGLHPAVLLSASSPVRFGISHFDVANNLLSDTLRLIKCPHVEAYAPGDAELILEGRIILDQNVPEGPFTDLTGTYDIQRKQPLVEVVGILHKENYLYQALLPAGSEHRLLMGMPQEVRVWEYVRDVLPTVKAVNMTPGGCGWLHCVVSVEKFRDGDAKNVLMAIFAANPSIKHAVVVDSDINAYDMNEVEWAIATRFRGDRGIVLVSNVRVSSLDPASDQETELGCKTGIDATRPFSKPKEKFELARIPQTPAVERLLRQLKD